MMTSTIVVPSEGTASSTIEFNYTIVDIIDTFPPYTQEVCHVVAQGDTITILNPARRTEIRWLAKAFDQSGNRIVRKCSVDVVSGFPPVGRK